MVRVDITWSHGCYGFRRMDPEDVAVEHEVLVPETTIALWEAVARLSAMVDSQIERMIEDGR